MPQVDVRGKRLGCVKDHPRPIRQGSGNQLSAEAGANLRELMARMGHDSTRAASIYLHSSAERQRIIADQVGENAKMALGKRSGTQRVRRRGKPS
jgi:hypothetical protein